MLLCFFFGSNGHIEVVFVLNLAEHTTADIVPFHIALVSRILADKIYRNRDNLRLCKELGIRLSGPALGRPKKDEVRDKTQDFLDECEWVEVERRFSLAKRKCGMGLITTKLRETIAHSIAMSILVLNLRKMQHALPHLFALLALWLRPQKNCICSGDISYELFWYCSSFNNVFLIMLFRVLGTIIKADFVAEWLKVGVQFPSN